MSLCPLDYLQIMSVPNLLELDTTAYDAPVVMETKKLPPLQVPSKDNKLQKTNLLNPSEWNKETVIIGDIYSVEIIISPNFN